MAFILASGCFAYYLYNNKNMVLLNSLRLYTYLENNYNTVFQYFNLEKNIKHYNIYDDKIIEIIKDNKTLYLINKPIPNIDFINNIKSYLLAVTLKISKKNNDIYKEIDLTDMINGFLIFNKDLDLTNNNKLFWFNFLIYKNKIDNNLNINDYNFEWIVIDICGDLKIGNMIINIEKKDLKIEIK